ncbi:MAG: FAD/NAD(P)-binding protein [Solirubrobacterales bacterium]|nr:FAD/NAD(P)-binding protein [Solirubrobacterales bacterium]
MSAPGAVFRRVAAAFTVGSRVIFTGADGETLSVAAATVSPISFDPPLVMVGFDDADRVGTMLEQAETFAITGPGGRLHCRYDETLTAADQKMTVGRVTEILTGEGEGGRPLLFSHSDDAQLIGHLPSQASPIGWLGGADAGDEPPSRPLATIAVVGGGASGTLTAVQLLRRTAPGLKVILIERSGRPGPGVAYGTEEEHHRLNGPAAQMIGLPDRPYDFLEWVRKKAPDTQPQEYLARRDFGQYLVDLLERTIRDSPHAFFRSVAGEVVGIDPGEPGSRARLRLDDGREIEADRVVLALGNGRPRDPAGLPPELVEGDGYVPDPWAPGALDRALGDESVLVVGTGLTMVDVAISLGGSGGPAIHAVSRHGLLPRAHDHAMPVRGRPVAVPDDRCSLTELTSRLLTEIAVAGARGKDWRFVLDSLRPITNDLWQALDRRDQKRFVTDLSRIWGVHRHRMAPRVALQLERLKNDDRLSVHAASISRIEPAGGRWRVELGLSSGEGRERLEVDRVVNCTGPTWDPRKLEHPLTDDLTSRGALRPDWLGIGFDVDDDGALIDADARPSDRIFAIGPPRNGVLLETTAVPEIGRQAELLAELLLVDLAGVLGRTRALSAA